MLRRIQSVGMLLVLASSALAVAPPARDTEQQLLARVERETNPVKKAKLLIRLGRMKLDQAFDAYARGDFDACQKLMDDYYARMQDAWEVLEKSGRSAARKPEGFKELDIALREARRDLEDFETRVSYQERQSVEKVRKQTDDLRSHVLNALFPAGKPKHRKQAPPPNPAGSSPPGEAGL